MQSLWEALYYNAVVLRGSEHVYLVITAAASQRRIAKSCALARLMAAGIPAAPPIDVLVKMLALFARLLRLDTGQDMG